MKRHITTILMTLVTCIAAHAMSYSQASREALYLTDKMAYELNLNAEQYDYAYEINLDYLLSLNTRTDLNGRCFQYRCADFRDILHDWQYNLFLTADYFLHPVVWRATGWFFPVYAHYHRTHFFYDRPRVYLTYHGGHGRPMFHAGYYASRRPHWDGGFRGHDMHHPHGGMRPDMGGRPGTGPHNGFRPDDNRHPNGGFRPEGNGRRPNNGNNGFRPQDNNSFRQHGNNGFRPQDNRRPSNRVEPRGQVTRPRSSSRNNFDYSSTRTTVRSARSSSPRSARPARQQRSSDNSSSTRGARR